MHKISKESIQNLANQLALMSSGDDTSLLLEKVRELYEAIVLLHNHSTSVEETKDENSNKISDLQDTIDIPEKEDVDISVKERIQQIMDKAAQVQANSKSEKPPVAKIEETKADNSPSELKEQNIPHNTLEEEFEDAISADYAADLFENVEKVEMTKKSLNDVLSQKQIQIGLNDRIAFVKHLFDGNQGDFNRVLSQLNSFQTEEQAKNFIKSMVKPDYNWEDKTDYEERFIFLIERKFL